MQLKLSPPARNADDVHPLPSVTSAPNEGASLIILLLLILLRCGSSGLATELDPKIVATWGSSSGEIPEAMAVSGRTVIVCRGRDGIDIIDFSNFAAPKLAAHIPTTGSSQGIAIANNIAYVADEINGLKVYDISQPAAPHLIGAASKHGWPRDIVVRGNYAYVAAQTGGLQIYDITNPAQPLRVSSCEVPGNPARIAVHSARAYLAGLDGVQIVDITDPYNPAWLRRGPLGFDVAANSETAYSATGDLPIIDLSEPYLPGPEMNPGSVNDRFTTEFHIVANETYVVFNTERDIHRIKQGSPAYESRPRSYPISCMALSGDLVYVATDARNPLSIEVIDFSLPYPSRVSKFDARTSVGAASINAISQRAAIIERGEEQSWLVILDISNPANLVELGRQQLASLFGDVALQGNTAVVICDYFETTLKTFDVADPSSIKFLGTCDVGRSGRLVVSGSYAYIYEGFLQIIDISDQAKPRSVATFSNGSSIDSFAVNGSIAALGQTYNGVTFLDLSNPAAPHALPKFAYEPIPVLNPVGGIALRDQRAFLSTLSNLFVIDVANPESPRTLAKIPIPLNGHQISLHGNTAYVGPMAIDITDPLNPIYQHSWSGPPRFDGFSAQFGFYADGALRVVQLDASANPGVISRFPSTTNSSIAVSGPLAFSVDRTNGFTVTDISSSTGASVLARLPQARADRVKVSSTNVVLVKPDFHVINLTNPAAPKIALAIPGPFSDAVIVGDYAYISDERNLRAFRINGPNGPFETASCPGGSVLLADGEYIYMAGAGLAIVDISLPGVPRNLIGYGSYGEYEMAIAKSGNYIYTAGYYGLAICDVSNPRRPWFVGKYGPPPIPMISVSLSVVGKSAYLLDSKNNLHVFDVSDPAQPRRVGGSSHVNATGLSASADTLYLVSNIDGLKIADLFHQNPHLPSLTILNPHSNLPANLRVRGPAGAAVSVQRSTDLRQWYDWTSVILSDASQDLLDLDPPGFSRFYRFLPQ